MFVPKQRLPLTGNKTGRGFATSKPSVSELWSIQDSKELIQTSLTQTQDSPQAKEGHVASDPIHSLTSHQQPAGREGTTGNREQLPPVELKLYCDQGSFTAKTKL